MDFEGKNVLITGGASGIGLEIVRKLMQLGCNAVGIVDINNSNDVVQVLKGEFPAKPVEFLKADVTKRDEIKRSFAKFIAKYKFADIVIGNAGFLDESRVVDMLNVNVLGVINSTYEGIEVMSKEQGGRGGIIVNISSIAGLVYSPLFPVYNATKHAVLAFTKSIGHEFYVKKHGINFITICPGITETPFWTNTGDIIAADFKEKGPAQLKTRGSQTPQELATCFADILTINKNNSVWIIDFGKFNEHSPPAYKL